MVIGMVKNVQLAIDQHNLCIVFQSNVDHVKKSVEMNTKKVL
jgi:hypothetical protein